MVDTIIKIIGYASDAGIGEQLHQLSHADAIEIITLKPEDTLRRRLRVVSDRENEYQIALSREEQLSDGAVLLLGPNHALVVRMEEERWLRLLPSDQSSAVELGYFAGNLHWRVRFDGPELHVALEGPEEDYLIRLRPFIQKQRVKQITTT